MVPPRREESRDSRILWFFDESPDNSQGRNVSDHSEVEQCYAAIVGEEDVAGMRRVL